MSLETAAPTTGSGRHRLTTLLSLIAMAVALLAAVASTEEDEDGNGGAEADTSAESEGPGFGNGTHVVGSDIEPGTYQTAGPESSGCYWARLSGLSGESDDIITNGNTEGPTTVEITPDDAAFESSGCQRWEPVGAGGTDEDAAADPAESEGPGFGNGTHVVGSDIEPGTYQTAGPESSGCYWARLSGLSGESDDIITNGNTEGPTTVEITPDDAAFESSGCQRWEPVG